MSTPDDLEFGPTIRGYVDGQIVFGRFTLLRILGHGGMGVVWLARDGKLEEDVAIKFMPEMVRLDDSGIRELKRETRKSLKLTHPHIVRIRDFAEDSQTAGIVMEYVDGLTLSALRLKQPGEVFSPEQLEEYIVQLVSALTYAHEIEGVVHRDLKPANLMVNSRHQLKVADFGISGSITDSVSRMSVQTGTSGSPPYMSPQQAMGEPTQPSDDIYSVGATIYELLTGKPPFFSGNIYAQIRDKVPPSMTQRRAELGVEGGAPIPEAWERAVATCLAKDPAERPQTAQDVLLRLSGEATGSIMTNPMHSKRDASPSSRKWFVLGGGAILLIGLAAGGTFLSQKKARSGETAVSGPSPETVASTTRKLPAAPANISPDPTPSPTPPVAAPNVIPMQPSPVVAASAPAPTPEVSLPSATGENKLQAELKNFVSEYLKQMAGNSPADYARLFSDPSFYSYFEGTGAAPRSFIEDSSAEHLDRWPKQTFAIENVLIGPSQGQPAEAEIEIRFRYEFSGVGSKTASGASVVSMTARVVDDRWQIVRWEEVVRRDSTPVARQVITSRWIFPDSDRRYLQPEELNRFDRDALWKARNEIYVRRGYIFSSKKGERFARSFGNEYEPRISGDAAISRVFNPFETANLELIQKYENAR